jgi:hypothetical protein
MILPIVHRPLIGKGCDVRFFYPVEEDGPGTLTILEYRCVLRQAHSGPHQVDALR